MIKKAKPRWSLPSGLEFWLEEDILAERKEWQKALDKEKARADVAKKTAQEFEEHYIDRGIELEKAEAMIKKVREWMKTTVSKRNFLSSSEVAEWSELKEIIILREAKSND